MTSITIGKRVKSRRDELGMTQPELSDRANVSQAYISELERGKYNPTAPVLLRLSAALRLTVGELLGEERRTS